MIYLIKKLVGNFLVIPGLFIVLAAGALISLLKGKKRLALTFTALLTALLYLLSTEPGKNLVLKPLEDRYPYPSKISSDSCNYIVVLGGGVVVNSPAEGGHSSVRPAVAKRLYQAVKVWRKIKRPIVVSGGVLRGRESEAEVMARFLTTLGVPKSSILEEGRSKTTFENALYTKELIGKEKICLITSAYHMPRSVLIFKSFGFKVFPIPADYRVNRAEYNFFSFLPFQDYLADSLFGFREYLGIAFFELFSKWRAREDSNLRPTD